MMSTLNQTEARILIEDLRSKNGKDRIAFAVNNCDKFHNSTFIEYAAVSKPMFFEALLEKEMLVEFIEHDDYQRIVLKAMQAVARPYNGDFAISFEKSLNNIFSVANVKDSTDLQDLMHKVCEIVRPVIKRAYSMEESTANWNSYLLPVQVRDNRFKKFSADAKPIEVTDITATRLIYYTMLFDIIIDVSSAKMAFKLGQAALGSLINFAEFIAYGRTRQTQLSAYLLSGMFYHFSVRDGLATATGHLYDLERLSRPAGKTP